MQKFIEFIDKHQRESKKQLGILKKLFEMQDYKVSDHIKDEDPFIFVHSPVSLTFEGIRIYKIGDQLAFRVQKEEDTHPFGRAYPIDIEDMFDDLMSEMHNPDKAGKEVAKAVISEIKRFFEKSSEAEKELRSIQVDPADPFGRVIMRGNDVGTDYANMNYTKG